MPFTGVDEDMSVQKQNITGLQVTLTGGAEGLVFITAPQIGLHHGSASDGEALISTAGTHHGRYEHAAVSKVCGVSIRVDAGGNRHKFWLCCGSAIAMSHTAWQRHHIVPS